MSLDLLASTLGKLDINKHAPQWELVLSSSVYQIIKARLLPSHIPRDFFDFFFSFVIRSFTFASLHRYLCGVLPLHAGFEGMGLICLLVCSVIRIPSIN